MYEITVDKRERGTPAVHSYKMKTPFIPRVGEFISNDVHNVSGIVKQVTYWWDEDNKLHPTVEIV